MDAEQFKTLLFYGVYVPFFRLSSPKILVAEFENYISDCGRVVCKALGRVQS